MSFITVDLKVSAIMDGKRSVSPGRARKLSAQSHHMRVKRSLSKQAMVILEGGGILGNYYF